MLGERRVALEQPTSRGARARSALWPCPVTAVLFSDWFWVGMVWNLQFWCPAEVALEKGGAGTGRLREHPWGWLLPVDQHRLRGCARGSSVLGGG